MKKAALVFVFVLRFGLSAMAQSAADPTFKLALPITQGNCNGQREDSRSFNYPPNRWGGRSAFGKDEAGRLFFLGFLFQVTPPSFTSGKCRDNVLESEEKRDKTLKILAASDLGHPNGMPFLC